MASKKTSVRKVTKTAVNEAQARDRQWILWDTEVKGFGLLVLPSGTKSFIYQYRLGGRGTKLRRYTIGRYGTWTPDGARDQAKRLAEQVGRGVDPIDAKRDKLAADAAAEEERHRAREMTFAKYAERWLSSGLKPGTRERTRENYEATLANHVTPSLGDKPLSEIERRDLVKVLDAVPFDQPAVRRITFAVMRMLFKWAAGRGDIDANPLEGIKAPSPANSRKRVLNDRELSLALRAAAGMEKPFGPFFDLIFATGQRRNEVAGLDWKELDRDNAEWILPAERSKNGQPHFIPLNAKAMAVLDALAGCLGDKKRNWPRKGLLFTTTGKRPISGFSRGKSRLDAAMLKIARTDAQSAGDDPEDVEIEPWRLHDARRTVATNFQKLGIRFEVTEAVLNHVSGASRSGIAEVYQQYDWRDEKKAALQAWSDHCDRILQGATDSDNVIPLRAANNSSGNSAQ
ncbi:site-specific integrase [Erythrobacter westpacificensis]|uniref:Site-specific integrase n=1 Tax=Erythrobacter westpacificensis TaxID=1055231 RepID=A0ABP9KJS5_9SPHN